MLLNIPKPELSPAERAMSISKFYDLPFHALDRARADRDPHRTVLL